MCKIHMSNIGITQKINKMRRSPTGMISIPI